MTCDNSCYRIITRGMAIRRNEILKSDFSRYERARKWIESGRPCKFFIFENIETGEKSAFISNRKLKGIPGSVKKSRLIWALVNDSGNYGTYDVDVVRIEIEMKRAGIDGVPHYEF